MKKYFLAVLSFSLIGFNTVAFAVNALTSDIARPVLTPTPGLEEFTLNNMPKIDSVVTTGQYAWALDNNYQGTTYNASAIFFNGQKWDAAGGQNIPNMHSITSFQPAYPVTGANPYAWILGQDANNKYMVSYFNGEKWITQDITSIFKNMDIFSCNLRASAGRAYLLCDVLLSESYTQPAYSEMDSTKDPEQTWSSPQFFSDTLTNISPMGDSFNDEAPYLFLLVPDSYTPTPYLIRINPDHSIQNILLKDFKDSTENLIVDGKRVYVSYLAYIGSSKLTLAFNDNNGAGSWTYAPDLSSAGGFIPATPSAPQVDSGSFCVDQDTATFGKMFSSCINFNDSAFAWSSFAGIAASNTNNWYTMPQTNGEWILTDFTPSFTQKPAIYYYDAKKQQLINTNFSIPQQSNMTVVARAIEPQSIVACVSTNVGPGMPELFFYNHEDSSPGWKTILTKNYIKGCNLSVSGNSAHIRNADLEKGESVWLFSQPADNYVTKKMNQ